MLTVFLRTFIIYIILLLAMRILGKRQLGELEVSELITTILFSEIASMPIANLDLPLSYAVIPLVTIMTFEVVSSFILSKSPRLKNLFSSPPSALIYKGRINQAELKKNRISPEELMSELRLKNITDPSQVEYAILEQNGLLSVVPKVQHQQTTLEHLKINEEECGIAHIIISNGVWNKRNLELLGLTKEELERYLQKKSISASDVYLLTLDDCKNKCLIKKEEPR